MMKSYLHSIAMPSLIALLCLALGCAPPDGDDINQDPLTAIVTRVAGSVRDGITGAGLAGATVVLEPLTPGQAPTLTATSGPTGSFLLEEDVPAGIAFLVTATLLGYDLNIAAVTTIEGAWVNVDVRLYRPSGEVGVAPATIDLGGAGSSGSFTLTNHGAVELNWQAHPTAAWITALTPNQGTLAAGGSQGVTVDIDRGLLGDNYGLRSSLVTVVTAGGVAAVDVRLVHEDNNLPLLSYDVAALDFGESLDDLTFTITNVGTGTLTWNLPATPAPAWLSFAPLTGSLGALQSEWVTVSVSRTGLAPSETADAYFGVGSNTAVDTSLPIRAHVEAPGQHAWDVTPGSVALPAGSFSTTVDLRNSGTLALDWSGVAANAWLLLSPEAGRLLPGDSVTIYAGIDPEAVNLGAFGTSFELRSSLGTLQVDVTGERAEASRLEVPSRARSELVSLGVQTVHTWVNNVGDGELSWTASSSTPWISVQTTSGIATGGASCLFLPGACGSALSLEVDASGFIVGQTYVGSIDVSAGGGAQSDTIAVEMTVNPPHYTWEVDRITSPVILQTTFDAMAAYDPVRDRVVLYGGGMPQALPAGRYPDCQTGTWEFDGASWSEVVTVNEPPKCYSGSRMVYDRSRAVMMLIFNGNSYPFMGSDVYSFDYDGSNWTPSSGGPAPQGLGGGSFVWSPTFNAVVGTGTHATGYNLQAYRDGDWEVIVPDLPSGIAPGLMADNERTWLQSSHGVRFYIENVNDVASISSVFDVPMAFRGGGVFDPDTQWYFSVSHGLDRGYLNGSNLSTGASVRELLPVDFGTRRGHIEVLDTRRHRIVVAGGTFTSDSTDLAYRTPMHTALLNPHAPGSKPAEAPMIALNSSVLDFASGTASLALQISNTGVGWLDFAGPPPPGFAFAVNWSPIRGGQTTAGTVTVNRGQLSSGSHTIPWMLRSDAGDVNIDLKVVVP